jgi:hypothetical protein
MNYYFIKNGATSGPINIEDIVKICDDETLICAENGEITDWKAAKLYPEYLNAKATSNPSEIKSNIAQSSEEQSINIPTLVPEETSKKVPPPVPSSKFWNFLTFMSSNKLILFVLLGLLLIYIIFNFISITNSEESFGNEDSYVTSSLKNNLSNLNGEWSWHDKKQDETYWLNICYNESSKSGTYKIQNKADDWGSSTNNELHTISAGNFILTEGQDRYGDKAYVAINTSNSSPVFAVTQLENRFASDWLLRISMIEDDMFGHSMTKLSNQCTPVNTVEEMTVPQNTIIAPTTEAPAAAVPADGAPPAATPSPATVEEISEGEEYSEDEAATEVPAAPADY